MIIIKVPIRFIPNLETNANVNSLPKEGIWDGLNSFDDSLNEGKLCVLVFHPVAWVWRTRYGSGP